MFQGFGDAKKDVNKKDKIVSLVYVCSKPFAGFSLLFCFSNFLRHFYL